MVTVTPLTLPSHASIFTGSGPPAHGIIDNFGYSLDDEETTLAEILRGRGFTTGGFVGSFVLDSRWGIAQGFDTYFDRFDAATGSATALPANERRGGEVLEPALEWIREQREEPFFAFIHFYDPHTPYDPPEPFRSRYGTDRNGRYDGEVAYVHGLVGRLLTVLEEESLYEDALIVLLGDHGESLGEHGEDTHGFFIYDATLRVPLILKAPGARRSGRVPAQVRTIDVMPTVLDLLGVDTPATVGGVSLTPLLRDPDREIELTAYVESHYARLHFGWAPLRGVRNNHYKYVEAPQGELYDLEADPEERMNLFNERPETVRQFKTAIEDMESRVTSRSREPKAIDAETAQRLQALGYVTASASAPSSAEDWKNLADPKERIDLFNRVQEATTLHLAGQDDLAKSLLASVLEQAPDVELAYTILGNLHLQGKDYEDAASVFRSALERVGESFNAVYGLAVAYKGLGRLEKAAAGFERSMDFDASGVRSVFQLAEVRMAQGRFEQAERLVRERLENEPDASLSLLLADALLAQNRRTEAFQVLGNAEKTDADNVMVQLSLGNLLMEDGDVGGALQAFERAKRAAPREARVFNALGNALARLGDDPGSLDNFRKAVELDPSFAPAYNNLGIALARSGRPAEAEKAFQAAIDRDPSYAEAFNNLGFLYLQAGAVGKAVPLFRRAISLKPEYTQAQSNLEAALGATSNRR